MTHWLTTAEASAYSHRSPSTLRRWRREGLPHYRPRGGSILYDRDELDGWMRRQAAHLILKRHNALHLVGGGRK